MSNVYFIQCKRHRKSFMYWCKTHQVGFGSKRELVNHCNQNSTLQCGGLLGYSWSYHEHEQQDDNENPKKGGTKEDEAYDNRSNDHTFLSWTFQQDDTDDQIGSDFNFGGGGGDSGGGTPGISVGAGKYREKMSRKKESR